MSAPLRVGQVVASGLVFRRIPNRANRFNYTIGRPRIGAFKPQEPDNGDLSVHLETHVSEPAILEAMKAHVTYHVHGLCSLDLEEIGRRTDGRVRCIFTPEAAPAFLGHAHAVLTLCDDDSIQGLLVELAKLVVRPQDP